MAIKALMGQQSILVSKRFFQNQISSQNHDHVCQFVFDRVRHPISVSQYTLRSLHYYKIKRSSFTCKVNKLVNSSTVDSAELGIVIVDHGSKRQASNDMLFEFVDMYRQVTGRANVHPAHMELAEPTIEQAIETCIDNGAHRIVIAPYFLSRGRHIQEDIPSLVREAQEKYPDIVCIIAEPIGVDPLLAQLIENRVENAAAAGGSYLK